MRRGDGPKLDDWICEQMPIADPEAFYEECLKLDSSDFQGIDQLFVYALQNTAFGGTNAMAQFLDEKDLHSGLTKTKFDLVAWVLRHPQRQRRTRMGAFQRIQSCARLAGWFSGRYDWSKTYAIDRVAAMWAAPHPQKPQTDEALDHAESTRESVKSQVFRALRDNENHRTTYEKARLKGEQERRVN